MLAETSYKGGTENMAETVPLSYENWEFEYIICIYTTSATSNHN